MTRNTLCVFILIIIPAITTAQMKDDSSRVAHDSAVVPNDSLFHMTKSPLAATLLSAAIPGAGQFYNEDYWKIPVIWAASAYFLYYVITYNDSFVKYQNIYFNSPDTLERGAQKNYNQKEAFRDARDIDGAFVFLIYALNVLDAYVSAHLFDFNVSDSKIIRDVRIEPYFGIPGTPYNNTTGVRLQILLK
jgi:hypothetical protein